VAVEPLAEHDVARVRADNPSPLTLDGSNSWAVGRDPCWVVDAGPALDEHLDHLSAEVERRGGLGGIALTHRHGDHADGVAGLRERLGPAPVAAATASGEQTPLDDGDAFGPLTAIPTPGHCPDHLAFVAGPLCFTGDAVLGQGSVFVAPQPGALAGYLAALTRLRAMELDVLCPGHGPPVTQAARDKLDEYLSHRRDRERRLVEALAKGLRGNDELLDAVWEDAPAELRGAAAMTLHAHLHKLAEEGRLPSGMSAPREGQPAPEV
jgi:glyoxylase-like metal-dependent hydrolase (beta-lactamase superfamily II)